MNSKFVTKIISIGYFIMVVVAISLYHTNVSDRLFLYWAFLAIIVGIAFLTMQICNARKDHHFLIENAVELRAEIYKLKAELLHIQYEELKKKVEEEAKNLTPTEQNEN